jgi:glyoxylase-like metal-dependent hydrolase (beta-lactamase superfamily II)
MTRYHGNVTVGGPPDVRELSKLVITKVAVGPMDNNAYVLRCRTTDEQLMIDAASDASTLLRLVTDGLGQVVTTHRHADHWQALAEVVKGTGALTLAHRLDAPAIAARTDAELDDGEEIAVGRCTLQVIHLIGHTPGSVALVYDDPTGHAHLFTGDSLFPGGIGSTFGNRENFTSLMNDVETKLFGSLPDETWVYPGHGRDTTLGAERPALPAWRARGW